MSDTSKSKFLALILRHNPDKVGIKLDSDGWCDISDLIAKTEFTRAELERIVANDNKGRYSIKGDKIRANQGHSTKKVDLAFKQIMPDTVLYHGTASNSLPSIMTKGLIPMSRQYVHLSGDIHTAETVGARRKEKTSILEVNAALAASSGVKFFISENGVFLTLSVPPKFLRIMSEEEVLRVQNGRTRN